MDVSQILKSTDLQAVIRKFYSLNILLAIYFDAIKMLNNRNVKILFFGFYFNMHDDFRTVKQSKSLKNKWNKLTEMLVWRETFFNSNKMRMEMRMDMHLEYHKGVWCSNPEYILFFTVLTQSKAIRDETIIDLFLGTCIGWLHSSFILFTNSYH